MLAENGTAGNVEFQVEIGQELTGNGMIPSKLLPPPQGASLQAYRTPVILKCAVQF